MISKMPTVNSVQAITQANQWYQRWSSMNWMKSRYQSNLIGGVPFSGTATIRVQKACKALPS